MKVGTVEVGLKSEEAQSVQLAMMMIVHVWCEVEELEVFGACRVGCVHWMVVVLGPYL